MRIETGRLAVRNMEIAWVFYQIADLLEFKGDDFFKIRAYRKAARAIAGLEESAADLYNSGKLIEVPGVGKNIMAKIGELLTSGQCQLHERLKREVPAGLLELMSLPGLGPKKIGLLHERLGISSIAELEEAARAKKIRELPGMGSRTEQEIIRGIGRLKRKPNQLPLGAARELAAGFSRYLKQMGVDRRVEVTGAIRRWAPMVDRIDLLVVAADMQDVQEPFALHPDLGDVVWREEDRFQLASRWGVPVEIYIVPESEYWYALLWSTGSPAHYRRLQVMAWKRGWRLNKCGLYPRSGGDAAAVHSEEEIYRLLELQYVPPELRENEGELSAAGNGTLPRLLNAGDIRGDLHVHTNWSDGMNSIEEMAQRAREKGYRYMAITDHSTSLKVARGLSREKLLMQHETIRQLNRQWEDFQLFTGIEVDILTDGRLDCPDEILAGIDVVVASVHTGFKQDRATITRRMLAAIENEHVDIIGHPTGRLLGHREPYAVDVEAIIEAAARHKKILEINASPDRLDLDEFYVRLARESGVLIAINTDAHDLRRLEEMEFGISVARRAWLEPGHVINTYEFDDLVRVLQR
ncbi:DNA polymerase (family 10) [Desulfotomaculum arcticum]|uniref:DNA polymerase beta n=1 Tax=Desulfotruncus arcticus DSM 17038 TaxID=1121424 RepID=A0A1I2ZB37_9FIRM|nr:DNA polymerase/3'-5' exonuclease PolX [Desulfotruncus arcticus]SFH35047.1 DNA polymerase (family 10) [Desulfotomaculum arcticum] [Desulfotruncus arcticus DSM 17038]